MGTVPITKKFTSMGEIKYNLIKSQKIKFCDKYNTGKKKLAAAAKKLVTIPEDVLWSLLMEIPNLYLVGLQHLQKVPSASSGQYPGRK